MITSASNQKIRSLRALSAKHKERRDTGLFIAEGVKLINEAPAELIKEIYVSESFAARGQELQYEKAARTAGGAGISFEVVSDGLFRTLCDTKTPQGALAVLKQPVYEKEALLGKGDPFLLVLEDLQDPGNVGTMIRTAEGAGAGGVILSAGCADIFAPKTVRSTMGSLFRVPFIITDDIVQTVRELKDAGIKTYAAMPGADVLYNEADYRGGCALMIGNEGSGLSEALAAQADVRIRIPMEGKLESLNAAAAAAILMYAVHFARDNT